MKGFPRIPLTTEFWRVNSYGYPSVFGHSDQARQAWQTFCTFFEYVSYQDLKNYWVSAEAPWRIDPHTVESWKATFEEFGLLFVESGSNQVTITEAGKQLRDASESGHADQFAWIGLNLLLRYPVRGPRRSRGEIHSNSDLLIYRFLYSALLDLDGYFWWSELEHVLCRVFSTSDAEIAIADVVDLRNQPTLLQSVDLPVSKRRGAFYNSLNQVAVHAGMNHLILGVDKSRECPYGVTESKRLHFIRDEWKGMVRAALRAVDPAGCTPTRHVARLPKAPSFSDEREYFDYAGRLVQPMPEHRTTLAAVTLQGEVVPILADGEYELTDSNSVKGASERFCSLGRGQRIILAHDQQRTYIVEDKLGMPDGYILLRVRRARPITNYGPIKAILEKA